MATIEVEISRLIGQRKIAIVMNAPTFRDADDIDYLITNVEPSKVTDLFHNWLRNMVVNRKI